MSSFSVNGSPTCTDGRRAGPSRRRWRWPARDAADAVAAGLGAEQHDDVADAAGGRQLDAVDRHHAEAERVDQRVALVARVEDDLAADVGQPQAVPVAADAGDDARQHALGVRVVGVAEAQRVHDQDRPGAHREDVAHDAADAGGRALVGLDVARVVVRLDLEGDRQALADVDDAGVLAHADEHPVALGQVAELAQVHLAALVGAVLAPHDRVHRQLGLRRPAAEHLLDGGVLVVLQPELEERLLEVRVLRGELDRVHGGAAGKERSAGVGLRCVVAHCQEATGGGGAHVGGRRPGPQPEGRRRPGLRRPLSRGGPSGGTPLGRSEPLCNTRSYPLSQPVTTGVTTRWCA
jgi:hypothetical protein